MIFVHPTNRGVVQTCGSQCCFSELPVTRPSGVSLSFVSGSEEETMNTIVIAVTLFAFVYLLYAMIRPEHF
jgi:K+-transporting ATPase KdpF subunit